MANNTAQLSRAVASSLLEKLGQDDVFRALFQHQPAVALQQVGASAAEIEGCAHCLKVTHLADKATIQASSDALVSMLTTSMGYQPHKLGTR